MAQRPSQSSALGRRPARQLDLMAGIAAHPRALHCNIAAVEANLAFGHAPPLADAASAAAMAWTSQTLRVLAQHLFHGSDPGHQTEAIERAVHILPSRFKAWHQRNR
jgi:hypothetical protein